jgi:ABC-type Fe3+/spermidine/putrescine transport system ATPase subunit
MDSIRLKSISARFRHQVKGNIAAVHNVSIDVRPGELMTLLGPSGCGKTTTLRMIAGFQEPSAGAIWIGDRDVTGVEANERNIGFVFQNYALFPHLSVFENVAYGLKVKRMEGAEIRRSVADVLGLVGLASYEKQMPQEEAMAISDRIAVMNKGVIEQVGTAEELYRRPGSVFVARFIGRSNLIEAVVAAVSPGRIDLNIAGQVHAIEAAGARVKPGQTVLANVRPEAIAIGTGEGLAAKVVTRTYLGEKMEYVVDVAGQPVQIVRFNPPASERFAPGDAVSVRLPHKEVQLLAKEGP